MTSSSAVTEKRTTAADLMPILRRHPEYDTPRKRANFERLLAAQDAGLLAFDAVPMYVRLEPHASCNLRCCWAQRNPRHPALRPRGAAQPDLAKRIVDQIGAELYHQPPTLAESLEQTLALRQTDIQQAAQRIFRTQHAALVIAGRPSRQERRQLQKLMDEEWA